MDSSTFVLFLILIGLAFSTGQTTLMYIGIGVAAIFLITMGGAHHIIIGIIAVGIIFVAANSGNSEYLLYSLIITAGLFIVFVLHGKEESQGGMGMEGYPMEGLGLPMGY